MEQRFDWKEILDLQDISLDFTTCQYPSGDLYGTADGNQCRKGTEVSGADLLKQTKEGTVSPETAAALSTVTTEIINGSEYDVSKSLQEEQEALKRDYAERLSKGQVTEAEIENLIIKQMSNEASEAEFVMIGMENGLSEAVNTVSGDVKYDSRGQESLANDLAMVALRDKYGDDPVALRVVSVSEKLQNVNNLDSTDLKDNTFISSATRLSEQVRTGETNLTKSEMLPYYFSGKNIAGINMAALAAAKLEYGNPGPRVEGGKYDPMDPNKSMYGYLGSGRAGSHLSKYTRSYVEQNLRDRRNSYVVDTLINASTNGKMKAGFAAVGRKEYRNYEDSVLKTFKERGYPVYKTKITVDVGGKPKTHNVSVIDLGNGKTIVGADFSLNAAGYWSRNNNTPYRVYSEAQKKLKAGTMEEWTPRQSGRRGSSTPAPAPRASAPPARSTSNSSSSGQTKAQKRAAVENLMEGRGMSQREINQVLQNAGLL